LFYFTFILVLLQLCGPLDFVVQKTENVASILQKICAENLRLFYLREQKGRLRSVVGALVSGQYGGNSGQVAKMCERLQ